MMKSFRRFDTSPVGFDGSFCQNRSFKNYIYMYSFSSNFLTKNRIRRVVPSVLRYEFQGEENRIFERTVLSKN